MARRPDDLSSGLAFRCRVHPDAPARGWVLGFARVPGPLGREPGASGFGEWIERNSTQLLKREGSDAASLPGELEMIGMLTHEGSIERGLLVRGLMDKYLIRAEAANDIAPGNFFNGPFSTLAQAQAAAEDLAASETGLRQGNALPRVWTKGRQSLGEVVRVYRVEFGAPGILSVAASQPEGGTVMVRPEHRQAMRLGRPEIAHEYRGGNNQLELPVRGMREKYAINIVVRVPGAEFPVKPDGTGF